MDLSSSSSSWPILSQEDVVFDALVHNHVLRKNSRAGSLRLGSARTEVAPLQQRSSNYDVNMVQSLSTESLYALAQGV